MLMEKGKPAAAAALKVDVVDSWTGFEKLRPEWQDLERRDMEATFFLSWQWLAHAFRKNAFRWSVIVVRIAGTGGRPVCILPLKYRLHWSRSREEFQTQLEAGGRLIWSEYTGFLCEPAYEEAGLAAAAGALADLPWAQLSMRYVAQQRRAKFFTERLSDLGFTVRYRSYRIDSGKTDNLLCPQVDLPEDFESYMANQISANTRQKFNKIRRRHLDTGDYRVVESTGATVEQDIATLLQFWQKRWTEQKGAETAERVARNYRDVLAAAQSCGALFLPVLYKEQQPLGALGHVLDEKNGIMHFIVAGRDIEASESFIGEALHFHSIAHAIERGFICYDFAHGNESYKYKYGAENMETVYFQVRREEPREAGSFDILCLGEAMRRMEEYLKTGKTERALKACAQLSRILP